jgi:MATE family multidrug resistance protein
MQEEQEELLLDTGINTIPEEDSVSFKQELGVMWSICWPVALSSFCRLVMALTDVSVLGHLGTDYLAGCALAWVWMDITLTFVWSLADSLSTLCSQAYGAKNYLLVGKWLQIGLLATAIGSIPVGLSWGYVSRILQGLGVDKSSA